MDAAIDTPTTTSIARTAQEMIGAPASASEKAHLEALNLPSVPADTLPEEAIWKAVCAGTAEVAVTDPVSGDVIGIIPPQSMVANLFHHHEEDVARLAGYMAKGESARHATEEGAGKRIAHRLPWLVVGILGASVSSIIVRGFEEDLQKTLALTFFIPAVVYMADAVGAQSEAILVRGMSLGISLRDVMWREWFTGIALGTLLATAFFPVAYFASGRSAEVAFAVAISLTAACVVATLVALVVPWALGKLGTDPAFGTGPLATVIQDILSITIYFLVAQAIV